MRVIVKGLNKIIHASQIARRQMYKFWHPRLWGKRIGINGIPLIADIDNLEIGTDVSINEKVFLQCVGGVFIGNRVTLSYGSIVLTSGLDVQDYESWYQSAKRPHRNKSVVIEDGAWIGANAMIMPGCKISRNVVVGAGSIVTKNLDQEGWLYAGNPAKPIKNLL